MSDSTFRLIPAIDKDLGDDVMIRRYLPQVSPQAVGPFIFFDYMPGIQFKAGKAVDVRPHPHIGLSTLSYLLAGRMHHRDSLGYDIIIEPGDAVLMTSGKGIVHSERTPLEDRDQPHQLHMVQFWLALPQSHEQMEPCVSYTRKEDVLGFELQAGLDAKIAIGEFAGHRAAIQSQLNPLLVDLKANQAGILHIEPGAKELAVFVFSGQVTLTGKDFDNGQMFALTGAQNELHYSADSHFLILGGDPLDGHRILWWNLVASNQDLIEQAKQAWPDGFAKVPNDDSEFIPLPAH